VHRIKSKEFLYIQLNRVAVTRFRHKAILTNRKQIVRLGSGVCQTTSTVSSTLAKKAITKAGVSRKRKTYQVTLLKLKTRKYMKIFRANNSDLREIMLILIICIEIQ
jgi:hypothetical protein